MFKKKIIGLMACDPNGLIGHAGSLPWCYPEESAYFYWMTQQQILIMGRKTFEDLPEHVVANRYCIVLSKQAKNGVNKKNVVFVDSLCALFQLRSLPINKVCYMIGGAEIAHLFLSEHLLSGFLLTHITKKYSGDTFLQRDAFADWPQELLRHTAEFSIYYYLNPEKISYANYRD